MSNLPKVIWLTGQQSQNSASGRGHQGLISQILGALKSSSAITKDTDSWFSFQTYKIKLSRKGAKTFLSLGDVPWDPDVFLDVTLLALILGALL